MKRHNELDARSRATAASARYRAKHPERIRAYARRRRAELRERRDARCLVCGELFGKTYSARVCCSQRCGRLLTVRRREEHRGARGSDGGYPTVVVPAEYRRRHRHGNRMKEHLYIAAVTLGRPLKRGECVHHINGDKADNRRSNLLICTNAYHRWLHERMGLLYAREHFGERPLALGICGAA